MKLVLAVAVLGCLATFNPTSALLAGTLTQQTQASDAEWSRVRNLVSGAQIVVTLHRSEPRKTYFVRADESDLIVKATTRGPLESIPRVDIDRIGRSPGHPARKGALIGVAIGAAVGAFLILADCSSSGGEGACAVRGLVVAMFGGIGAGSGAAIGALIGAFRDKTRDVIYRAP
jgi:hypothetical protein